MTGPTPNLIEVSPDLREALKAYFLSSEFYAANLNLGCRVYNNAALTIGSGAITGLTFNSERYDTDSFHSTSVNTGRITFNRDGRYLITAHIRWASNATGYRQIYFRLNAATIIAMDHKLPVTGDVTSQFLTTIYDFVATDYIEVIVFQNSGGNLNVDSAGNYSPEIAVYRLP